MATAGASPTSMRGSVGWTATTRKAPSGPAARCTARLSHPSAVDFVPGVPLSQKSCASKCERVAPGSPAA